MKTYEDGLNDAWEAARKIGCADGYKCGELEDIFGSASLGYILGYLTASEAIDAIEKHEKFKVGDEGVNLIGKKSFVVRVSGSVITIVESDGMVSRWEMEDFEKTGRHFPQIAEVLKQMQEEE